MDLVASLRYFAPELVLTGFMLVVIVGDLAWRKTQRTGLLYLSIVGVVASAFVTYLVDDGVPRVLFSGMIVLDPFAVFFKYLALAATGLVLVFSLRARATAEADVGELSSLTLAICLGMMLMAAANELLMIYIAVEVASITGYILAGLRRENRQSAEAALKYVIYGGVASGLMIYGMSLLYGLTGSFALADLRNALAGGTGGLTLLIAVAMVMAGFGYKIASVPFHMWCPDVYEGAPTPVTALLSVGPKAAGFAVLIRFVFVVFVEPSSWAQAELVTRTEVPWALLIVVLSMATMTVGNLAALAQNNLKRFLAYSSIAHAGYLLMGPAAATKEGLQATLIYLAIYLFMNLGAFLVVIALESQLGVTDVNGAKGLSARAPLLAVSMAIFLFSLTGIPPFAGFIGKLYLFSALLSKGGTLMVALAVVAAINSVISLYYYARILRAMFLDKAEVETTFETPLVYRVALVGLVAPILVFGLYWQPLETFTRASVQLVAGL